MQVRPQPRFPVGPLAAALFAVVALALVAVTRKGGTPGGLADTGNSIGPWTIVVVVLILLAGLAFLVVGQRRRKK